MVLTVVGLESHMTRARMDEEEVPLPRDNCVQRISRLVLVLTRNSDV